MAYSDGQCRKQESWKQGEVKIAEKLSHGILSLAKYIKKKQKQKKSSGLLGWINTK